MFNGIIVPLIDLFLHYALEKKYRNAFTLKSIYCFCDQTKIPDIKVDVISKDIEKIKGYLEKNEDGKYTRKKGVTCALIAKELHFTEMTVEKYIRVINDRENDCE